jgi:hypothetical protein
MARKGSDSKGSYVIVEKGDTLSQIAVDFAGGYSKYKQLAAINDIQNPNLIFIGQKIYLTSAGSTKTPTTSNTATIKQFGLLSTPEENKETLFATWSWGKEKNTESYKVLWTYYTSKGVELQGTNTTITVDHDAPAMSRQSLYDVPSGATKVRFKVKPISKTKDDKNKTTYFTAEWTDPEKAKWTDETPLTTPNKTPTVSINKFVLTASINGVELSGVDSIVFQVIKDNDPKAYATSNPVKLKTGYASYTCSVEPNGEYKVRCYAYSTSKKTKSDWTGYSESIATAPSTPDSITELKAIETVDSNKNKIIAVYMEWSKVSTAKSYDVQYTTVKDYFDNVGGNVIDQQGIEKTNITFYNLEPGSEYFFRVRAVLDGENKSEWTEPKSVVIGVRPSPPTTWSSSTMAIVGESINLYWVHNPRDNSTQTFARLKLKIDGSEQIFEIPNNTDPDEKDKTSVYTLDTSDTTIFEEGVKIEWQVQTKGVTMANTDSWSDWSTNRTIDVYARPRLDLELHDVNDNPIGDGPGVPLSTLPLKIKGVTWPATQNPIGYSVSIKANQAYETVDTIGNPKYVNLDEVIYSEYFDIVGLLDVELGPSKIDLANGMSYTVTATAGMNSGLVAEESKTFTVAWADVSYEPNAEIGIDPECLTATIRPYCSEHAVVFRKLLVSGRNYTKTNETLDYVYGEVVPGKYTTDGELVYQGVTMDGASVYYCEEQIETDFDNVYLAVYRREYDGKFTEIASGIDAALNTAVTDPHPALDYARYRVVATSKTTGTVNYYDLPAHYVGCTSVVIQWDEDWSNFDVIEDEELVQPPWTGSLLRLPYNIDVNESPTPDVSFVEYIGREHPVSYYGTQVGESATWSAAIPKEDKETIYALRRLSKWTGNAYVREPSGVGYWANIGVSFNQKHKSVTVPVSISVKRVEGGV